MSEYYFITDDTREVLQNAYVKFPDDVQKKIDASGKQLAKYCDETESSSSPNVIF